MSIIDDVYSAVAHAVVGIHAGLRPVFGPTNGFGWALSIVLLTMAVRLVLFPLFVKQIKSQRTLQTISPQMKEIREKYKGDKQRMNEELMKLQKEHGNPLLGCLPILAQVPLFIALFRVLNGFKPQLRDGAYVFEANHGLSQVQAQTIGNAKIFGVPLSTAFNSPTALLRSFVPPVSDAPVRVVTLILVVIMCTTTFLTQKQIIGRNGPVDPAQRTQQRVFLYLAPISLGVSGIFFGFPVGVLLYWMTTNLWSMGQQFFVLRRLPPVVVTPATTGRQRAEQREAPPEKGRRPGAGTSGREAPPSRTGAKKVTAPVEAAPARLRQARRQAMRTQPEAAAPTAATAPAGPTGPLSAPGVPASSALVAPAGGADSGAEAAGGASGASDVHVRVSRPGRPPQQRRKSGATKRRGDRR